MFHYWCSEYDLLVITALYIFPPYGSIIVFTWKVIHILTKWENRFPSQILKNFAYDAV